MPTLLIHPPADSVRKVEFEFPPGIFDPMDDDAFFDFCQRNEMLQMERTADGEIEIMSPTGWKTGFANLEIGAQLRNWAKLDGRGCSSDSNTGYYLNNRAERAPDASWISKDRLAAIPETSLEKFLPAAPDFVIELRSPSDRLAKIQEKMEEYVTNGVELGWLIDPFEQSVHIYGKDAPVEILKHPKEVCGTGCIEGFVLDLSEIF